MLAWNDGTSLYHYGVFGQKWGERRYQNEDGTYTEEGLRRKRLTYPEKIKNSGQVRSALNAGKQITDSTRNIGNNLHKKTGPSEKTERMSDEELRKKVNRMLLENQYENLKGQRTESGRDTANRILAIAGDIMAIGASAASILMAIYTIKNKPNNN